jgi:hypothetical protein
MTGADRADNTGSDPRLGSRDGRGGVVAIVRDVNGRAPRLPTRDGAAIRVCAARRAGAMAYYTNVGPKSGPILWRDHYGAIGVVESPDNRMPIGIARGGGPGPGGPGGGSSSTASPAQRRRRAARRDDGAGGPV